MKSFLCIPIKQEDHIILCIILFPKISRADAYKIMRQHTSDFRIIAHASDFFFEEWKGIQYAESRGIRFDKYEEDSFESAFKKFYKFFLGENNVPANVI